jgi:opacity protein-like surface antigen
MKGLILIMSLLVLVSFPHSASAGPGRGYVGAQLGMFLPIRSNVTGDFPGGGGELTYDPGLAVFATTGYRLSRSTRVEAEVNFRRLHTDRLYVGDYSTPVHSTVWAHGFMANIYYDFVTRTVVTPYIGAGVGFAWVEFDRGSGNGLPLWKEDNDLSVAYQGIAGFAVQLTDATYLDFAYRHFAVPRLHLEQLSAQFRGPNVSLGIRHYF